MVSPLACAFVKVLDDANFLPSDINTIKLMFLVALIVAVLAQILDETEIIQFCLYPIFCVAIFCLGGTTLHFSIPLFGEWLFDKNWSFDVDRSLKFWAAIGCIVGLVFFFFKLVQFRVQYRDSSRSQKFLPEKQSLGKEGTLSSIHDAGEFRVGLLSRLSRHPMLVLLATFCTIVGFFFGSGGEFVQHIKTALVGIAP